MRYLLFVLSISLNCYLLFFLSKKYQRSFLLKAYPALIPITIAVFFALGLIVRLLGIRMNFITGQLLIAGMMALIVISMINFINQFFFFMVDSVVEFHQKHNAPNVDRQPIKFFIVNQAMLKRIATIIWFLGATLMLYGIWLGNER